MKNIFLILLVTAGNFLPAQEINFTRLTGKYLGQKEPGLKPEIFAEGLVSKNDGVFGDIVFTPDFSEAVWQPNYKVNGRSVIYIMKYRNNRWEAPAEFYLTSGSRFSQPCYSCDGKRLYFKAGKTGASGLPEFERICYSERDGDGWTDQRLLSHFFDTIPVHYQFSLDKNNDLYFSTSIYDGNSQICISKFRDGKYLVPVKLPETINSGKEEFSPFISPDESFLIFTRNLNGKDNAPDLNLFVSFRDNNGQWQEAQNLTKIIGLPAQAPFTMMSAARVTPDGKYLFFTFFNGTGTMVYWVDAKIIEKLRPKGL